MKKYILLLTFIAIACAAIAHADRDDDESNRSGICECSFALLLSIF